MRRDILKLITAKNNCKGMTLIEVIIATTIIAVSLTAIIGLVIQAIIITSNAKQRTQASFLAQEAIEIAQNIRDTNYKKKQSPFDTNLYDRASGKGDGWYKLEGFDTNNSVGWRLTFLSSSETVDGSSLVLNGVTFQRFIRVEKDGDESKKKVSVKVKWNGGETNSDKVITDWHVSSSTASAGIKLIANGNNHSLAVLLIGEAVSWGNNQDGQLGDGTSGVGANKNSPVYVRATTGAAGSKLAGVVSVAAGQKYSLALLNSKEVVGWGHDGTGQLGNNDSSTTTKTSPVYTVAVGGAAGSKLTGVTAIAASPFQHSLALLDTKKVVAWGYDNNGELGDGAAGAARRYPDYVRAVGGAAGSELTGVKAIVAGNTHSLALLETGEVVAWGGNSNGQLGDGTSGVGTNKAYPVYVRAVSGAANSKLTGVTAIAAGYDHSMALLDTGEVVTWGGSTSGVLGDGVGATSRTSPDYVRAVGGAANSKLTGVTAIAAGYDHNLAALNTKEVVAWGNGGFGKLGDGGGGDDYSPVYVRDTTGAAGTKLASVKDVAGGGNHSACLLETGEVMSWGWDGSGQLGNGAPNDGSQSNYPVYVDKGATPGNANNRLILN